MARKSSSGIYGTSPDRRADHERLPANWSPHTDGAIRPGDEPVVVKGSNPYGVHNVREAERLGSDALANKSVLSDTIGRVPGLLGDLAKHVIEDRKGENTAHPDRARGNVNQDKLGETGDEREG